jgi:hypothetical protein
MFADVLPNVDGHMYTINCEIQSTYFQQGYASVHSYLNDGNDQAEASDVIVDNSTVTVSMPLLGYDDGGNDNNNFGQLGLVSELASIDYRDLLHSEKDGNGNTSIMDTGMLFEVELDALGNPVLKWWANLGGWKGYVPGVPSQSGGYETHVTNNGKSLRIWDVGDQRERVINVGYHLRWQDTGTGTPRVYHLYGAADDFGLVHTAPNSGGEGEAITEDQTIEMLAAAGDTAQYAAAVDAAFAGGEMSA